MDSSLKTLASKGDTGALGASQTEVADLDLHSEAVGQESEYDEADETAQSKRQRSASTPKKATLLEEFESLPTRPPSPTKKVYSPPLPSPP